LQLLQHQARRAKFPDIFHYEIMSLIFSYGWNVIKEVENKLNYIFDSNSLHELAEMMMYHESNLLK